MAFAGQSQVHELTAKVPAAGAALDLVMAPETCGQCVDGWVCEIHLEAACVEECGVGMPCQNPACPLSFDTESDPATGLVRPHGSDEP
jgi:hypothetical protein